MDFAPYLKGDAKYQRAPDMIYSFKNIGKAEITGVQAEVHRHIVLDAVVEYTYARISIFIFTFQAHIKS